MKLRGSRFFTFLNEAFRLEATEQLQAINIIQLANYDKSTQRQIIGGLEKQARDILDLIEEFGTIEDHSGIDTLRMRLAEV